MRGARKEGVGEEGGGEEGLVVGEGETATLVALFSMTMIM